MDLMLTYRSSQVVTPTQGLSLKINNGELFNYSKNLKKLSVKLLLQ